MKLGEYSIDIYKEGINGKDKRNEYLLKKLQELDSEAKEAEDTEYFEVNVDGWIFWVNKDNQEIELQGEEKNPLVRIRDIKLISGTNSITVELDVSRGEGAKYKYYYKKQDTTDEFKLAKETNSTSYTIENLEQNVTYVIKVEATNKNGTVSKEAVGRTGEIPDAQGAIEFGSLTWNNGKAEVTITKTTSDSMKIQYRVTVGTTIGEYQEIASGEKITNLELGSIVTARLWDGTNGGNTTSLNVQDLVAPEITEYNATISGKVITATMTATDNTGITPTYEYKLEGENYQKENTFTIDTAKTYKIYFRATDKSGNQTEKIKDVTVSGYTVTYDANGGEGAPASQTGIIGENLTLSNTVPTKTGYTFLGWSTDSNATTATYAEGATYTENKTVTLYAVWKVKTVKVTFMRNIDSSDTTSNVQTFTYGVTGQKFSDKGWTRTEYTLLGWNTDKNATTAIFELTSGVDNSFINARSPAITLYAVWKKLNPETFTGNEAKGVFIKYDVEYTDVANTFNYEYTSTNGWRLENYDLASDGKTLSNVRLISTGVPARMSNYYDDTTNNYSKWITNSTKLEEYKNNVLGTDYKTYTGSETYYALQASAGFYYNLGQMTFEQGTSYDKKNQGYYTKIKNGNVKYTSGETIGNNLFKARSDASIRMLTLPEINRALGRSDIDSIGEYTDATGLYNLENISTGTALTSKIYKVGEYWLASPWPMINSNKEICTVSNDILGYTDSKIGWVGGVRPIVSLTSKVQLVKKTDSAGIVYYEMIDVN